MAKQSKMKVGRHGGPMMLGHRDGETMGGTTMLGHGIARPTGMHKPASMSWAIQVHKSKQAKAKQPSHPRHFQIQTMRKMRTRNQRQRKNPKARNVLQRRLRQRRSPRVESKHARANSKVVMQLMTTSLEKKVQGSSTGWRWASINGTWDKKEQGSSSPSRAHRRNQHQHGVVWCASSLREKKVGRDRFFHGWVQGHEGRPCICVDEGSTARNQSMSVECLW